LLKKVHVARNGQILGTYEFENLGDMVETGSLLPTDHFFDEQKSQWVLLSTWKPPSSFSSTAPPPKLELATADPASDSPEGGTGPKALRQLAPPRQRKGGKSSRSKKGPESAVLAGWISCMLALGVAAGLWAWAQSLREDVVTSEEKITNLNATIDALRKQNDLMSEITPAGHIRGIITYETTSNQVAIMSGATVGLYKRSDVEEALGKSNTLPGTILSADDFDGAIEKLKTAISSPVEITLTDSRGRLDLGVPSVGDYVLVASAAKTNSNGGTDRFLWLLGFHDQQQPSSLILLNERNAISLKNPQFAIKNLQPLTQAEK